jgi:arginine decarboxylase
LVTRQGFTGWNIAEWMQAGGAVQIFVGAGTGRGSTTLAAFDSALRELGAAHRNLIRLSSVIPEGSTVQICEETPVGGEWGDRLYCVYAESRTEVVGQEVWAGVAWAQDATTNRGLFVEHEGSSKAEVERDLDASLSAMISGRGVSMDVRDQLLVGAVCEGVPVSVLVLATYETEAWKT